MKFVKCFILSIFSMSVVFTQAQSIKVNQVGYYSAEAKTAIVPSNTSTEFKIYSAHNDQEVYSGNLSSPKLWEYSQEAVKVADFSDFIAEGEFYLNVDGLSDSYEFSIKNNINVDPFKAAMKAYYFNRASTSIPEQYGGVHKRQAGHPDNVVYIHSSAASTERPTGSTISAPKGWYDAGDYGKYIVNSGISTYTVLAIYEHYPEFCKATDHNIPESGNAIPDVLEEAKWNLDWMLDMQDPNDGGVYHKLTTLNFTGEDMPHQATADRYVVMKTTAAALDFAAVMAQASRIFTEYETEFPGYSTQCLEAAKDAWDWAQSNPNVLYSQPEDVKTGTYGDWNVSDEFDWAAAELYITTQEDQYLTATNLLSSDISTPGWAGVNGLAWISLAHHIDNLTDAASITTIRNKVITHANSLRSKYNNSAYKTTIENFYWGSNSLVGNDGLMLLQAFKLTQDSSYFDAAISNLDYLLGKNATGYSFVTGYGSKSPQNIHHRQSVSDGIAAPVPGFLAGGPQPGQEDGCTYPSNLPALSYSDTWCSYASNEVTINWNAPLAYLLAAGEVYARVAEEGDITNALPEEMMNTINVFPTVSTSGFTVENVPSNTAYEIFTVQGQALENGGLSEKNEIGASLSAGTYLIKLQLHSGFKTFKVIKQ